MGARVQRAAQSVAVSRRAAPRQAVVASLRSMRDLKQDHNATVIICAAFVQNVRRGHYELAVEEPVSRRLAVAFDELALAI
jgi:hypothetical protein